MLRIVKTTLDAGGTRAEFVSPEEVVELDMMKERKKKRRLSMEGFDTM
jgi:hypothetical protein